MYKSDMINTVAKQISDCSDTPFLDARFFCEHYQMKPTTWQLADFIQRRKQGEPVSKILGQRGFWKRDFIVSKDVLDPRPDSETIIETVLRFYSDKNQALSILDIGTGSGCLLLTLLDEYPQATGIGVDKSKEALCIARQNDVCNRAIFQEEDFTTPHFGHDYPMFDIIISNPPYIKTADVAMLDVGVRQFDPLLALDGGEDGLDAYRALSVSLSRMLKQDGTIFFEIGQNQEQDVIDLMAVNEFICVKQVKDLSGIIRVLVFCRKD